MRAWVVILLALLPSTAWGAVQYSCTAAADGVWNNAATWAGCGPGYPTGTVDVTIEDYDVDATGGDYALQGLPQNMQGPQRVIQFRRDGRRCESCHGGQQ